MLMASTTPPSHTIPAVAVKQLPVWAACLKRTLDIGLSLLGIIVLLPLYGLVAVLIWRIDGRPILFRWSVVGRGGQPFASWKFRTMHPDAEQLKSTLLAQNEMNGPVFKMKNDPRVTRLGRLLRKFSIDELPQLWSVLKGDMSLVGPRPPLQSEFVQFEAWQREKLAVKPGLTCLWQIRGRNQIRDFDTWIRMDLEYIEHWSLWLDMKILLKTIPVVLRGRGAQ
jgi:lipopolysaccharide/colanic/teichoic acid biosynthesis glycosyltransferase